MNNLLDKKISLLSKKDEKDIYYWYKDSTNINHYNNNLCFFPQQHTNPTKSKYDNVVGWIRREK